MGAYCYSTGTKERYGTMNGRKRGPERDRPGAARTDHRRRLIFGRSGMTYIKGFVLALFVICVSAWWFPASGIIDLPRTGQTRCWDNWGNETGCDGTGQDGDIRAGGSWPSPRFAVT